jgi:short-subunit dehydrogenase
MKFKDKVIWITGAASGIGEALAYQAIAYGGKLILSDVDRPGLSRVADACTSSGASVLDLPLDLASRTSIEQAVEVAIGHFGRVDVLINNGGISQRSLTWETPLEVDQKIMNVNFFGAVILTKAVLPHMMKAGSGCIAATSSITGKFGFPLRSAYAASKHATQGFFETLSIELADQNISVTIAMPGRVRTNISVNALTRDGTPHGQMDPGQAAGITAERCARKYLDAIHQRKHEVLIGGRELMIVHIRRFLPSLFYRLARKIKPE